MFREHGYDGASLTLLGRGAGLGRGSLYHFFPGGKQEMADAVLTEIDDWFQVRIFAPLRDGPDAAAAIRGMLEAVDGYFRSGRRVCLVGSLALGDARDRFAARIRGYFAAWTVALTAALARAGRPDPAARAEDAVSAIQGALVLARALDDPGSFARSLDRIGARLLA